MGNGIIGYNKHTVWYDRLVIKKQELKDLKAYGPKNLRVLVGCQRRLIAALVGENTDVSGGLSNAARWPN